MTYHNTDIAACINSDCQLKEQCLRWQLWMNKDPHQVYANFEGHLEECDHYINIESIVHKPKKEENQL